MSDEATGQPQGSEGQEGTDQTTPTGDQGQAAAAGSGDQGDQGSSGDQGKGEGTGRTATTNGVPDEYTLSLEEESPLSDEHMDEVAAYARKQGLSNQQAQEILERDSRLVSDFQDQQMQTWERTVDDWAEQARADKEIGGDNLAESSEIAKRVLQRYGTEPLMKIMESGYGNHPELIRFFSRIGKELVDAKMITSEGPVGRNDGRSTAETLYGNGN